MKKNFIVVYKKGGSTRIKTRVLPDGSLHFNSVSYDAELNIKSKKVARVKKTLAEFKESLHTDTVDFIIEVDK